MLKEIPMVAKKIGARKPMVMPEMLRWTRSKSRLANILLGIRIAPKKAPTTKCNPNSSAILENMSTNRMTKANSYSLPRRYPKNLFICGFTTLTLRFASLKRW